jgi:hypothetical protein
MSSRLALKTKGSRDDRNCVLILHFKLIALVAAERAQGVADVEQHMALDKLAVWPREAAGQEVDGVRRAERQYQALGKDEVRAFRRVQLS